MLKFCYNQNFYNKIVFGKSFKEAREYLGFTDVTHTDASGRGIKNGEKRGKWEKILKCH